MADSSENESIDAVAPWDELDSKPIADCRIFDVLSKRFRHPTRGTEGDFYVIETRDWVNVLPITEDFRMILVNQFRFGVKQTSWEIPGGVMLQYEGTIEDGVITGQWTGEMGDLDCSGEKTGSPSKDDPPASRPAQ